MARQIEFKVGDHTAIIGATGSGKTVFGIDLINQYILGTEGYMPVYILDTKGQINSPEGSDFKSYFRKGIGYRHTGNTIPPILTPKGNNFCMVWTPLEDDDAMYDEFFKAIYQAGSPALIFVDELSSVSNKKGETTRYHDIILKQGRGLSISNINLTQSPSHIGRSVTRQTMHMVKFRINNEYDSKKLADLMGKVVEQEIPDDYGFWYRNVTVPTRKRPAVYYRNKQEFFGVED